MSSLTDPWEPLPDPIEEWRNWWAGRTDDGPASALARTQGFVLAAADLERVGVTRAAARHRIRTGRWLTPAHGVVAPVDLYDDDPDLWTAGRRRHALVSAAGALRRREHVVSGRSAAILHGMPTIGVPAAAELTDLHPDGLGRRAGAHLFGAELPVAEQSEWWGVPVTTPARSVLDLARHGRRDGIVAADAALRHGLATRGELERLLETAAGWPGVRQAREIVALATPKAESPLESITRLLMHDDGMPAPEPQYWIAGYRVDLALVEQRLVIEADGRVKYEGDAGWREKKRHEALRRAGWRVERVLWTDTTRNGWRLISERLWTLIRDSPSRPIWS